MKILAIIGSPRKKESYEFTEYIESELKRIDKNIDFEYVMIKDIDIELCRGCHNCFKNGEDKCPIKDDKLLYENKMKASDGIIFITPIYSNCVTPQLKNYIDRYAYFFHRPRLFKQKVMSVALCGGVDKGVNDYIEDTMKAWGMKTTAKLVVPHVYSLKDKHKKKFYNNCEKQINKFYKSIEVSNTLPKPGLGRLLWFRLWKMLIKNSTSGMEYDYRYWKDKGWLNAYYYYDTKINVFKKLIVNIAGKMLDSSYKKRIKNSES